MDELPAAHPGQALLLATKLFVPWARESLVARPRLIARLGDPLQRPLTLVYAPAGYGKTTLVVEWLGHFDHPIAWLSLDEADNDPVRFLSYLVAALQTVEPEVGRATSQLLGLPRLPAAESLVGPLVNDLAAVSRPFVLVLDDYHAIHTPLIHEMLEHLVAYQPQSLHLVLATRHDPPLPLARLRTRGRLLEVRAHDLRFTPDEAAEFLRRVMDLELGGSGVEMLASRTEGWAAGLQLAGLSLQGRDDANVSAFLADFSGSDRLVLDYLVEEVLHKQPDEVQAFLRDTAILDRLSGRLCDAVTGGSNGQAMLERLERANLFVVPLDSRREWYRYHQLFADVLQTELDEETRLVLHARAARWLGQGGYLEEAISHTLAARDWQTAGRLIAAIAEALYQKGEYATVLGWIDALPADVVRASVDLALTYCSGLVLTARLAEAETLIAHLECTYAPNLGRSERGRLLVVKASLIRLRGVDNLSLAREALEYLGDDSPSLRQEALGQVGHAHYRRGEIPAATATFRQAYRLARELGQPTAEIGILVNLAYSLFREGRRSEAELLCRRALEEHADGRSRPLMIARVILVPLGLLRYEADDVAEARREILEGLDACRRLSVELQMLSYGAWTLARVQLREGAPEQALSTLRDARSAVERAGMSRFVTVLAAYEADLTLRSGDVGAVARWVEESGLNPAAPDPSIEVAYFTLARVWLAQGRALEARELLARLESAARVGGRFGSLITVHTLQAIAEQAIHQTAAARGYLESALRLAAPEGYRRAFLDEGPVIAEILPEVREIAPVFVDELLAAFDRDAARSRRLDPQGDGHDVASDRPQALDEQRDGRAATNQALPEPLSARELEVLEMIAEGRSNAEIAEALVIGFTTAKWHVSNVLGKLGVKSRTQAVSQARELGLLD